MTMICEDWEGQTNPSVLYCLCDHLHDIIQVKCQNYLVTWHVYLHDKFYVMVANHMRCSLITLTSTCMM